MRWRYSQDLKVGFRIRLKIEESLLEEKLIHSKKFGSLFIFDAKTSLYLCKYFPGLKISFGSTPKGCRLVLEVSQKVGEYIRIEVNLF